MLTARLSAMPVVLAAVSQQSPLFGELVLHRVRFVKWRSASQVDRTVVTA